MSDPELPHPWSVPCVWSHSARSRPRTLQRINYEQWVALVRQHKLGLLPSSFHAPVSWVDYFKHYNPDHIF